MTPRSLLLSLCIIGTLGGLPVFYGFQIRGGYRNLRMVDQHKLYRSGKLNPEGFQRVVQELKIRCVVTFRIYKEGDPNPDGWEEEYCKRVGIRYEKIVPKKWGIQDDGRLPAEESVARFLALMDKQRDIGPTLVHCLAGKHRTGAFVAIYRMEYQGWSNAEALAEMKEIGYDNIDSEDDVRWFLERYRPRRSQ